MKAFYTEYNGSKGIVYAETNKQAAYTCYLSAKDAGLNPCLFDIRVTRANKYDNAKQIDGNDVKPRFCYSTEYLKS